MNVGELKKHLAQFPEDMEVLYCRYSDYEHLKADEIFIVNAVDQNGYCMRSHPTMSELNKSKEKYYLLFPGN